MYTLFLPGGIEVRADTAGEMDELLQRLRKREPVALTAQVPVQPRGPGRPFGLANYRRVMLLVAEGLSDSEIARQTGINRTSVRRYRLGIGVPARYAAPPAPTEKAPPVPLERKGGRSFNWDNYKAVIALVAQGLRDVEITRQTGICRGMVYRYRTGKSAPPTAEPPTPEAPPPEAPEKDPAAVALGRRGGLKGGKARMAQLSPEERRALGQQAAAARWGKTAATQPAASEPEASQTKERRCSNPECPNLAEPGHRLCERHAQANREQHQRWRARQRQRMLRQRAKAR